MAETVSIQEFSKLDLRVGKVLDVRDHPNASKLYLLDVDLGPELGQRQTVAGLKPYEIITHVNDKPVTGPDQFAQLVKDQQELRFTVLRMIRTRLVKINMDEVVTPPKPPVVPK